MTDEPKTLIVERMLRCLAERVWRALTVPHLMAEWLMRNDFAATVDHRLHQIDPRRD